MAKTFNRPPYTLNTPSNSDIKTNSFVHTNWKGINIDKNFLEADQQTFADTKNVYVDSEGLLRSRPSSKITHIRTSNGVLSNIVDVWVFEHVKIYMTENEQKYKLHIFNGDNILEIDTVKNIKLVLVEQKIFVFTETSLHYYDVNTNEYFDAENYIYVPVKTLYKNNAFTEYETENELTSSYRNRYLFEKVDDLNFEKLIGKNVIITIGDVEYNVNFVQNNQVVFVEKKMQLSNNNFISIPNFTKYPLVSVSENDVCIISTCNNSSLKSVNTYDIYYTTDFVTFNHFPTIEGVIGLPKISKDGFYAYCMKSDDLYVISIANRGQDYYTDWKPLLQTKYTDWYNSYDDKPWYIYPNGLTDVTAEMDSIDLFSIFCIPIGNTYTKNDRGLISCDKGVIKINLTNSKKEIALNTDTSITHNSKYTTELEEDVTHLSITQEVHYTYRNTTNFHIKIFIKQVEDFKVVGPGYYRIVGRVDVYHTNDFTSGVDFTVKSYDLDKVITNSTTIENSVITITGNVFTIEAKDTLIVDLAMNNYKDLYIDNASFGDYIRNIKIYSENSNTKILVDNSLVQCVDLTNDVVTTYDFQRRDIERDVSNLYCSLQNDICIIENRVMYCRRNLELNDDTIAYVLFEYYPNEGVSEMYIRESNLYKVCFDKNGNLLTSTYIYINIVVKLKNYTRIPLLFTAFPICVNKNLYFCTKNGLYSNNWNYEIVVDELIKGENKYLLPEYVAELSNIYFSKNKTLYISKYPSDGIFKWYFPKLNTEEFDYKITNLHPISPTEMAVFTNSNVYYVQTTENGYMYYKSKIQVGCKDGADVMTTYDGVYTIFASSRGLVAMTYQQFVATTEQALSYLTDGIYELYNKFNDKPVKLFKHLFWIVCYKEGASEVLLFDTRNNSWWFNSGKYKFNKIVESDNNVFLLMNNELFVPNTTDVNYYDFDGTKSQIEWFIKSQKLHLNSLDYQKNIRDITLVSVLDSDAPINLNLQITNYRKTVKEGNEQLLEYRVDSIRTFVKHLNCMKVNQMQYVLKNNEEAYIQIPLSLSSLSIKYRITRQVR